MNSDYSLIRAFLHGVGLLLTGQVRFPRRHVGSTVTMEGEHWTVFREAVVWPDRNERQNGAVFIARFHVANMTVRQNIAFSLLPIPLLVGLPGFRSKLWMYNGAGDFQGVYEWDSAAAAERYAHSAAVRFMTRRSLPGSVSFTVIPHITRKGVLQTETLRDPVK